eukprot:gene11718-15648_t
MGAITSVWLRDQAALGEVQAALAQVPDGATLWVATAGGFPRVRERDDGQLALWHPPMKHAVSLASLHRPVFVPSTWADPFKQPMRIAPAFAAVKALQGDNPLPVRSAADLAGLAGRIATLRQGGPADHLLLLSAGRFQGDLPQGVPAAAAAMTEAVDAVVVGGGFYGCCIAVELARHLKRVVLFEAADELLTRASRVNQARLHNGYHYPRSFLTAARSHGNFDRFRKLFPDSVAAGWTHLYALARNDSKVGRRHFERLFATIGAPLRPATAAARGLFEARLVDAVYEVEEPAFN